VPPFLPGLIINKNPLPLLLISLSELFSLKDIILSIPIFIFGICNLQYIRKHGEESFEEEVEKEKEEIEKHLKEFEEALRGVYGNSRKINRRKK
jgi:hypothetical protein